MAQTQKEEVRERIVSSAKEEFLAHGYENSSMRRIALKSRMTVGNLYRYFTNKEELLRFIVGDTFDELNEMVKSLTNNELTLSSKTIAYLPPSEIRKMVQPVCRKLAYLYVKYPTELNILMMGSVLNKAVIDWFASMLEAIIERSFPQLENIPLLGAVYATAIFNGAKLILRTPDLTQKEVYDVLYTFFNSYLSILEKGL